MKKIFSYFKHLSGPGKALYFFLILLFTFLILRSLAPAGKKQRLNQLIEADSLFISGYNTSYNHPDFLEYVKDKAYREALLDLATKDSIQLAVNLADSSVCLHINGVRIHQTRIRSFKQDKFLASMQGMQVAGLFSKPLRIIREYATIVKMPVVERHAPKDTLEAAMNAWKPDTLIQKPAFLLLETEHGIDLIFEQEGEAGMRDDWMKFSFFSKICWRRSFESIGNFFTFSRQEYHPRITMQLPARDLRAIYRALPREAYVVLRIY